MIDPSVSAQPATGTPATNRRLHPLTPVARTTSVTPGILLAVLFFGAGSGWARLIGAVVALAVLYTVVLGLMYLEWSRYSFGFDDLSLIHI